MKKNNSSYNIRAQFIAGMMSIVMILTLSWLMPSEALANCNGCNCCSGKPCCSPKVCKKLHPQGGNQCVNP